jgi:hypothetical protein
MRMATAAQDDDQRRASAFDAQTPILGRRLLAPLEALLRRLHQHAAHGNRVVYFDHVLVAHLVAFFNPTIVTLRNLEDIFSHARVRRLFKLPAVHRSTLSDAQRLFDPQLLRPLVDDLVRRLKPAARARGLDELTRRIVAVDATFFEVAARIVWALPHNGGSSRGAVQMCLHFDVVDGIPIGFSLVDGNTHEATEFATRIQPNTLYLLDRAYQSYERLDQIAARDSDFVVRLRKSANFDVCAVRPLSAADRLAGVQHDWQVRPTDRHYRLQTPLRLVEISVPGEADAVRLLTNRLDLSAELIGTLYRHRWQIELFFRWLKCVVQQKHFRSESPEGITIQLYATLIGTLLIGLEIEGRPSKYDFNQMSLVFNGWVTLAEAQAVMRRRRAERARAAAWQKDYNARRKIAR